MNTRVRHISTFLNQWAPPDTKLDYDNVGLLVGNPEQNVSKILTCLDITTAVVEEAIERNCELIVSHHPLIFQGMKRINPTNEQGKILYRLIQNEVSVIAAHTNLDAALDGVSFTLAEKLGLHQLKFLDKSYLISRKIVLTTKHDDTEAVLKLLNYYSAEEAHVHAVEGRKGNQFNYEATIDQNNVPALKKQLKKNGLLEQGNLQVIKVASASENAGMGVIGLYRDKGLQQEEFLSQVSEALNVEAVRFSGKADYIKRVAVCGGAGVSLARQAIAAGAQAFVTADIKYHDYFIDTDNFLLVDAGHYQTEWPIVAVLKNELAEAFEDLQVFSTTVTTNPVKVFTSQSKTDSSK